MAPETEVLEQAPEEVSEEAPEEKPFDQQLEDVYASRAADRTADTPPSEEAPPSTEPHEGEGVEDPPQEPETGSPSSQDAQAESLPPSQHADELDDPEIEQAKHLAGILRNNPKLRDAMVAYEKGEVEILPKAVIDKIKETSPEVQSETSEEEPDEIFSDPFGYMKKLAERQEQIEQRWQAQEEGRQQAARDRNMKTFEEASDEFYSNYPELKEKSHELLDSVAQNRLIAFYIGKGMEPRQASRAALEGAARLLYPESVTSREMGKRVHDETKRRRAGGSAAKARPLPKTKSEERPRNKQERIAAMAADIAAADSAQE